MNARCLAPLLTLLALTANAHHERWLECSNAESSEPPYDREPFVFCETGQHSAAGPIPSHQIGFFCDAAIARGSLRMSVDGFVTSVVGRNTPDGFAGPEFYFWSEHLGFFPDTRPILTALARGDSINTTDSDLIPEDPEFTFDTIEPDRDGVLADLLADCEANPPEALSPAHQWLIGDPDGLRYESYRIPLFPSRVLNVSGCFAQLEFPPVCPGGYNKPWINLMCDEYGTSLAYRQAMKTMIMEWPDRHMAYACPTDNKNRPAVAVRIHEFATEGLAQP